MGVLSLQSTTISEFHFGILGGIQSIIDLDKSSIINCRGTAIKVANPRIFKVQNCVFQKVSDCTIEVKFVESEGLVVQRGNGQGEKAQVTQRRGKLLTSKVIINQNRFINIENFGIYVSQTTLEAYHAQRLLTPRPSGFENCRLSGIHDPILPNINATLKISSNKSYNTLNTFISLDSLRLKHLEVSKNDILKNQKHALSLVQVQPPSLPELRSVFIKDNLI